ncbi:MAG TPA: zinc-dependent metalloprotease [Opitutaceae bacterium]
MKLFSVRLCVLLIMGLAGLHLLRAEQAAALDAEKTEEKEKEEKKPKTVAEVTKESDRIDGLFTLFRDRKTGDLRILLKWEQMGKKHIYFGYTEDAAAPSGRFRGYFNEEGAKIVRFDRYFNRVELVVENSRYLFDENKAISRAAGANISPAVIGNFPIEAENEESGECLINVNKLFLSESLTPVAKLPDPEKKPHEIFLLGKLNADHSKIRAVRNYPKNTDVVVEYVYQNESQYVSGGDSVADPRTVSIRMQHSLIEAPDNDFKPRHDDPRVGYFVARTTDLSSTEVIPYRDMITRWHLVKRNPEAAVSEPVEPIVFWIENTTPVELRPIIEKAALRWNEAFLDAGFENAFVIKTQPDDADWEAGDLRYNVIRWVSSPAPFFGGYGPSFADLRTGQILGAEIMIEHFVISRFLHEYRVFGPSPGEPEFAGLAGRTGCLAADLAHRELLFGRAMLESLGAESGEQARLLEEFMYYLVLHEIGHTLGLNHNFRASHLHSLEDIFDREKTYPVGLSASVMDYDVAPFVKEGRAQGQFWTTRPGPYDKWAIEFGYSTALDDPKAEAVRLETILSRSTEPHLAFANDADDMREPGKAIDPRAMVDDMSSDPVGFALSQMEVVESVVPKFGERLTRAGESYQEVLNGFHTAASRYRSGARVASRFVGGVHVDRAMVNQPGASTPLVPVDLDTQKRAMALLRAKLFAPDAMTFFGESASLLLAQRRGFDHLKLTEDPKLHDVVLSAQKDVLDHLLHPVVLKRLSDTRAYGNAYTLAGMLSDLTAAVFEDDMTGEVNTYRQNLQTEFVNRLLAILKPGSGGPGYDYLAQSMALNRLRRIERQLAAAPEAGLETTAHRESILYRIKRGLDETRGAG